MQSILEFLESIHNFLASDNALTSSIYVSPVVLFHGVNLHSAPVSLLWIGEQVLFPNSSCRCGQQCQTLKSDMCAI